MPKISSIAIIVEQLETLLFSHEVQESKRDEGRMQNIDEKELRFLTIIYPLTEPLLKQFNKDDLASGAEKVIETLEQYIAQQIEAIPEGKGTGQLALSHLKHRRQVTGELGPYHTALRAIFNSDNVIGPYRSLLHKGSNEILTIAGEIFSARVVLACLWLVASHPDLNQEKDLVNAKINFIATLAYDIRRGHNSLKNGDFPPNLELDAPTCEPGTVTELLKKSIQLNKLKDEAEVSCKQFPEEILNFVYESLEKTVYTVRIAAFSYVCFKLGLASDLNDKHVTEYEKFIEELSTEKNIGELIFKLQFKLNTKVPDKISALFKNKIEEIIHIIQEDLLFKNNIAISEISFQKILHICVPSLQKHKIGALLSEAAVQNFIAVKELLQKAVLAKNLAENEYRKLLLFPNYIKSDTAQIKKENLINWCKTLLQSLQAYNPKFEDAFENSLKAVAATIADEYSHEFNIKDRVKTEISKDLDLIQKKYQDIEKILVIAESLLTATDQLDATKICDLLSKAPLQQVNFATANVMQWVYGIANIIFAVDEEGNLIKDEVELGQFLELTYQTFSAETQQIFYSLLNEYLKKITQLKDSTLEAMGLNKTKLLIAVTFLNDICYQRAKSVGQQSYFSFVESEYESDVSIASLQREITFVELANEIKEIFSDFTLNEIIEMDQYARKRIYIKDFPTDNDSEWQKNYENWKQFANKIIGKECSPMRLLKLKMFAVLTMFHNLGITKTLKINVQTIEYWCDMYLVQTIQGHLVPKGGSKLDAVYLVSDLAFPLSEKSTLQSRIASLAGHLACVLTRFSLLVPKKEDTKLGISCGLFNDGYICLMSSRVAQEAVELYPSNTRNAMIVRISNSSPHKMAVTYKHKNNVVKFLAEVNDKNLIKGAKIEGKWFDFEAATDMHLFSAFIKREYLVNNIILPMQSNTPYTLLNNIKVINEVTKRGYVHLHNSCVQRTSTVKVGYTVCDAKVANNIAKLNSHPIWETPSSKRKLPEAESPKMEDNEKMEIEEKSKEENIQQHM